MASRTDELQAARAADGVEPLDDLRRPALWAAGEIMVGLGMDRRAEQRLEETTA